MRSIYDNVAVGGVAVVFASNAGVIVTGPSIDTKNYSTAALRLSTTAVGGAVTATAVRGTVVAVIEESVDNSTFTTATDVTGATIGATATPSTVNGLVVSARIEGLGLQRKRYLRVKLTTGFGPNATTAAIFTCAAVIEVGRGYNRPPTADVSNT